MKIVKARITEQPKDIFDPMPEVWATFEDGTEKLIFWYYPDEIFFSSEEFIGLTEEEAVSLKQQKDVIYLRS